MAQITATLKNAKIERIGDASVFLGNIYGDANNRWPDGQFIRTSKVDRVEGDLVYTRNSVYKIDND